MVRCSCSGIRHQPCIPSMGAEPGCSSENAREWFLLSHTERARKGKQRGLPREMVLLHTGCFLWVFVPQPSPGMQGWLWEAEPGLSRGVPLLQALIRCVLVSKTLQTKAFHLHLCTVPVPGQGLVSARAGIGHN